MYTVGMELPLIVSLDNLSGKSVGETENIHDLCDQAEVTGSFLDL